ncbi:MAG: bifunctional glutamate N-acetyltransferase/amino-acid acetyltransferase ArgJ [Firmicutes bacterium]|nr:bifunctional glutamate N-acetyltransferase/amino-acid acetyltransferase ArgJ [Bacillota bacterium]
MTYITGGGTGPRGFSAAGISCGLKKDGAPDLALVFSESPAVAAGVFTTNKVKAAPVIVSREHLAAEYARAVVINSGNANACLGEQGLQDARAVAAETAGLLEVSPREILLGSTGVIGMPLPVGKILDALPALVNNLSPTGGAAAARAIMTTDTRPKEWGHRLELGGGEVRIGGMAKGSGMINPKMATLLAVITTDARVERELLREALREVNALTFNRITVDGDTSTNDTVFLLANGKADAPPVTPGRNLDEFKAALYDVAAQLAKMLVQDGEGATKIITVRVTGAATEEEAEVAARAVANSNLVKTAFFGEDANWGRILAAVGYSGIDFSPETTEISLGGLTVFKEGKGLEFSEEEAARILKAPEVEVVINLHRGAAEAGIWTCDLSYDYVRINASYRS